MKKRILILLLALLPVLTILSLAVSRLCREDAVRIAPESLFYSREYPLYYADTLLDSTLVCDVNRPYISVNLLRGQFGLDSEPDAGQLRWPVYFGTEGKYIALSDAAALCRLGVVFEETDSSVHLYDLEDPGWAPDAPVPDAGHAYIRLEDIMADEGRNGRFTHENLVKLRTFGAYLADHADAFYIAWIPLYVNPGEDVRNDISSDESFYNADFVFTLDCLAADGGRIGLHGLTHQHADEVSASGYEFGDDFRYTDAEVMERFRRAEDICGRLGYTAAFFEFPHYSASADQKRLAEEHFSVVYQQDADAEDPGHIERHEAGGHTCLWVPTPAKDVRNHHDGDGISERLTEAHDEGKEISLYFHPAMDFDSIRVKISGTGMTCSYDESEGILPRIVRLVGSWGFRFSDIR